MMFGTLTTGSTGLKPPVLPPFVVVILLPRFSMTRCGLLAMTFTQMSGHRVMEQPGIRKPLMPAGLVEEGTRPKTLTAESGLLVVISMNSPLMMYGIPAME